jgi:hypothetical protein
MDDIAVERTGGKILLFVRKAKGGNIFLFVRKAKGDKRRTAADKTLLKLPIAAVPLVVDFLEVFTARRTTTCNQLDN